MKRRIAAILVADIVGYSAMMGANEEGTARRLAGCRELIDAEISKCGRSHGLMSIPRSARRSTTLRSDNGYFTYIITTRRMTSGELLKYRKGLSIRSN